MVLKRYSTIFAMALLIFGMVLSLQFRSTFVKSQSGKNALDIERLKTQIEAELSKQNALKNSVSELLTKKDQLIKYFLENSQNPHILGDWEIARLKACLTSVEGPGVIITLNDAPARTNVDPNLLIIHDTDMRIILNDLKKAGAQAISINDERITPMSELVCAGPTIRINGNRYSVPYIIKAIGNPARLVESLELSDRIALMKYDNIRVDVKKSASIVIPAFDDPVSRVSGLEVARSEVR